MEGALSTLVHLNTSFHRVPLLGRFFPFSALLKQVVNLYFQPLDLFSFLNPSVLVTKKDYISQENIPSNDIMTVPRHHLLPLRQMTLSPCGPQTLPCALLWGHSKVKCHVLTCPVRAALHTHHCHTLACPCTAPSCTNAHAHLPDAVSCMPASRSSLWTA